ncbi:MAG: DUF2953 domain-containing protein [Actinomycetota bacterium]
MIILWFLLGLFGFILFLIILLIILLLLVPFRFEISASREEILEGQGTVSWLGRMILVKLDFALERACVSLSVAGFPVYTTVLWPRERLVLREVEGVEAEEKEAKAKPKRVKKMRRITQQFSVQALCELLRLVLRMARSLKLKGELRGEIGLSDPAATGMLFGLYHAVRQPLGLRAIDVEANFEEACLKGSARFSGQVWMGALAFNALRFAFAPSIRTIWISELKALIFHGGG